MTQENTFDEEHRAALAAFEEKRARIKTHYANAKERFLAAWIRAVEIIGPEYFECNGVTNFREATDRDQIQPNNDAIEERINVCSAGEGVFIGTVMSFYNDKWGAEICDAFGHHGVGGAANRLDLDELEIVMELMSSHTGW